MDFEPIVILTLYCEASSASQAEREAVGHVILNRTRDHRYPNTPAAVCMQPEQFSEFNGDKADWNNLRRGLESPPGDPAMQACAAAWVMAKNVPDTTGGATHYHDKSIDPPKWTIGARVTLSTSKFIFYAGVK